MSFFSLFRKKDRSRAEQAETGTSRARRKGASTRDNSGAGGERGRTTRRDRQAAFDTALKIDAIESEMSSEFITVPAAPPTPARAPALSAPASLPDRANPAERHPPAPEDVFDNTTNLLFDSVSGSGVHPVHKSAVPALLEEAAVLYASREDAAVEQLLRGALAEEAANASPPEIWLMLFDLYQILGRQQDFEQLSINYANTFETSPPPWLNMGTEDQQQCSETPGVLAFVGKLDSNLLKQLEQLESLSRRHHTIRLDFLRVAEVYPAGCAMLMAALQGLQKSGHELVLVGADALAIKIRAIVEPGRRDDTEPAWLLLLELLRLLDRESEFEEASIEYCVTFEVSPPSFVPPKEGVPSAAPRRNPDRMPESFLMPTVIEGRIESLISSLTAYSENHHPAVVDCSQLARVELNAAGRLLTALAPLPHAGKALEFHNVNRLVAELFKVTGLDAVVRLFPRKN